ncbi:TorD/DmsD family molecular chaperone [Halomonas faecis]|uniref:TorD/DmsD family molecular chaperone n=1 Tax=Halomonas faecis TaxID=1562110 RepID=UPI0013D85852|nr:molecular chaperone TorD family protein [Halomonas faecis]
MTSDRTPLASAELYLCLSRAFLTPVRHVTREELRDALLPDLRELAGQLPAISDDWLARFTATLDAVDSSQQLLLGYSKLFLTPPAPAPLNLGAHLDGAIQGRSALRIEALYRRHGLERATDFHDLPDHLALNLQWLAWMLSRWLEAHPNGSPAPDSDTAPESRDIVHDLHAMLQEITHPGVARLRQAIAVAVDASRPEQQLWQWLVELTQHQLAHDMAWLSPLAVAQAMPASSQARVDKQPVADNEPTDDNAYGRCVVSATAMDCRVCGERFPPDAVLSEMHERLTTAGLDAAHLALCSQCREVDTASPAMTPPSHEQSPARSAMRGKSG